MPSPCISILPRYLCCREPRASRSRLAAEASHMRVRILGHAQRVLKLLHIEWAHFQLCRPGILGFQPSHELYQKYRSSVCGVTSFFHNNYRAGKTSTTAMAISYSTRNLVVVHRLAGLVVTCIFRLATGKNGCLNQTNLLSGNISSHRPAVAPSRSRKI